jgi:hypothetical protein
MTERMTGGVSTLQAAPMFYADQLAAITAGPHVCRLTFGVQEDDGSEYPRAVVTVAVPTIALMQLLSEVGGTLNHLDFRKQAAALQKFSLLIKDGVSPEPMTRKPAAKRPRTRNS